MGCCGGGRTLQAAPKMVGTPVSTMRGVAPSDGPSMVVVQYVGRSVGTRHYRGPATGLQYVFGLSSPVQKVHASDAPSFAGHPDFIVVGN